jgi:hypothetical protein
MLGANPTIVSYNVGGVQKISSPQIAFLCSSNELAYYSACVAVVNSKANLELQRHG